MWWLQQCKIIITRDVIFDEATPTPLQLDPSALHVPCDYLVLFPYYSQSISPIDLFFEHNTFYIIAYLFAILHFTEGSSIRAM